MNSFSARKEDHAEWRRQAYGRFAGQVMGRGWGLSCPGKWPGALVLARPPDRTGERKSGAAADRSAAGPTGRLATLQP
jgi:hypothetical protein